MLHIDNQNHAGLTLQSLRATIGPLQGNQPLLPLRHWNLSNLTLQQQPHLTNMSLDHSRFFPPHSTVLSLSLHSTFAWPPRQPCIFAWLGCWQLLIKL